MPNSNSFAILSKYLRENSGIESVFGHININVSDILGQGGNGIVYSGKINDIDIAIKFLINYNSKKLDRFKAEYLNINIVKEKLVNVVNCIEYDSIYIDDIEFPYIIMKRYKKSLKKHRNELSDIKWQDLYKLFNDLCKSLKSIEECGIVHRDLKPENILIDENDNYIITDFGIAHFESEDFPIVNLTEKGDRLANFEFSAPEQLQNTEVSYATDIYSLAQIIYWFAFGQVNRGTGGRTLQELYNTADSMYLNSIIHKCLSNEKSKRYQTIDAIYAEINNMKFNDKEINPFDDMDIFSDIVRSVIPEFYRKVGCIEDPKEIQQLMYKINTAKFNRQIQYNTGLSNNRIKSINLLENGNYLLDYKEIKIIKIWGLFGELLYNDILILETEQPKPYNINGKEYYGVAIINKDTIVPVEDVHSGYVRYKGKVYREDKIKIQERYIHNYERGKYLAIGSFAQCTIISKNDTYMRELQKLDELDEEAIITLQKNISKNKSEKVYDYM